MTSLKALMHGLQLVFWWTGMGLAALGLLYSLVALLARLRPRQMLERSGEASTPVTILKPLCGLEPQLYDCLRSFCVQRYPHLQIVFGVANPKDPAAAVVRRLQREHPWIQIDLVVDGTRHGNNPKVSNLINMMRHAKHDWLLLADSDIRVPPDYLERLVEPLNDEGVGLVTSAYTGRAAGGLWSNLGVEFIRGWFTPSVFVSNLLGSRQFAFGATIAMRRGVLDAIGGFRTVVNHLADDYHLGAAVRALDLRTILSDVLVETTVHEPSFRELAIHQLRWMRTIRGVRPIGYALAVVTFSLPLALLGCLLTRFDPRVVAITGVILLIRAIVSVSVSRRGVISEVLRIPLIPLSDLLAIGVWCIGFQGRDVVWREDAFTVDRDGLVFPTGYSRNNGQDGIQHSSQSLSSGETL